MTYDLESGAAYVFIKKSLGIKEIPLAPQYAVLALCCFEIRSSNANLRFINVYRLPTDNRIDMLMDCLNDMVKTKHTCIITGDLNCADIDWSRLTATTDGVQNILLNFAMANGFHQSVQVCTRGNHILHIVLCNESLIVSNTKVAAPFSNSDHSRVFFTVDSDTCERQVNSAIKRYDCMVSCQLRGHCCMSCVG